MQGWHDIEFANVSGGMSTNVVIPGQKFAKRILNLHNHQSPGKLKLRAGYSEKYPKPVCSISDNSGNPVIIDLGYMNFDLFFDRQAIPDGKEITLLIQKTKVKALTAEDSINMLCFWVRPYWNPNGFDVNKWTNEWQWLNTIVLTKIVAGSDETYPNMITVSGNEANGITEGMLNGFTIYNQTKNQFAKVITSKGSGGVTRICHTLYNSTWETEDVVIIGNNWIDIQYQNELFNVEWKEIQFHRILNDLRIGFGGYVNRPGLAVGYRKKFFQLDHFDFENVHPDIEVNGEENFARVEKIALDNHVLSNDAYGIELIENEDLTSTALNAGSYYFRLTGIIDQFQEMLIAENNIELAANRNISAFPFIKLGKENSRITDFNLYISSDNITFELIREYNFTSDSFEKRDWIIDSSGRYIQNSSNPEIYTKADAADKIMEGNNADLWQIFSQGNPNYLKVISTTDEGSPSNYVIYSGTSPYAQHDYNEICGCAIPIQGLKTNTYYEIKFYSKRATSNANSLRVTFVDNTNNIQIRQIKSLTITNDWTEYAIQLFTGTVSTTPTKLAFGLKTTPATGNAGFYLDQISIHEMKRGDIVKDYEVGVELKSALGYTPTYNIIRGWDQVLTFRGRAYYLNPFIERRYENYILVSHIHSNGSFMYDIASFSNYRELEKFDSNEAIGMALLPTMEILILKDASITAMSDDGTAGILREPVFGVSCLSRNSIVNMNGIIFFCGGEDIYMLNISQGFVPSPLLKETIRDIYLALSDKESIFCVKDKHNTYRLRTYKPELKTEYLLTENGWIEEKKWHFPEIYRAGFRNKLYFLSQGSIYAEEAELDYSATSEIIMTDDFVTDLP